MSQDPLTERDTHPLSPRLDYQNWIVGKLLDPDDQFRTTTLQPASLVMGHKYPWEL
jgi:hypothetical protein